MTDDELIVGETVWVHKHDVPGHVQVKLQGQHPKWLTSGQAKELAHHLIVSAMESETEWMLNQSSACEAA